MSAPVVVYTDFDVSEVQPFAIELQERGCDVKVLGTQDPDVILREAPDVTCLMVGMTPVDAALIARLPHLKLIAMQSQGYDHIDVEEATRRGIWVANVGDVASTEVAEHSWAMTWALVRQLGFFDDTCDADWGGRPTVYPRRMSSITLGLVGIGRIGTKIARLATGQAGRIVCYGTTTRPNATPPGAERVETLDELLAVSDVVSVQISLTPDTVNMFNAETFAKMKRHSYFINVGRGGLVDSNALRAAIDSGHLEGAAIDVFDQEPPPADHPLLGHPQIWTTPHIAYLSPESEFGYFNAQYQNVVSWLKSGVPNHPLINVHDTGV